MTAPVLTGAELADIERPTDSEAGDAPHNPDVWDLRSRINRLVAERAALVTEAERRGEARGAQAERDRVAAALEVLNPRTFGDGAAVAYAVATRIARGAS